MPTGIPPSGCSRSRSRPIPSRTPPSAVSVVRRGSSRPSAGSRISPTRWARTRSKSARPISTVPTDNNITPYHQKVEDNVIHRVVDELEQSVRLPGTPQGDPRLQPEEQGAEEGHRADAGQVRHLVHRDLAQSGRGAGACLSRWFGASQPWRHRDGAGAPHQGGAGACRCLRHTAGTGEDHSQQYRQGAEHVGHGGLVGHRSQRHGGARWRQPDQGAWRYARGPLHGADPPMVVWQFGGIRAAS
jgi:hypothetical protein